MTAKNRCKDCKWLGKFTSSYWSCDYLYLTGIPRRIPKEECYKHEGTPYEPIDKTKKKKSKGIVL